MNSHDDIPSRSSGRRDSALARTRRRIFFPLSLLIAVGILDCNGCTSCPDIAYELCWGHDGWGDVKEDDTYGGHCHTGYLRKDYSAVNEGPGGHCEVTGWATTQLDDCTVIVHFGKGVFEDNLRCHVIINEFITVDQNQSCPTDTESTTGNFSGDPGSNGFACDANGKNPAWEPVACGGEGQICCDGTYTPCSSGLSCVADGGALTSPMHCRKVNTTKTCDGKTAAADARNFLVYLEAPNGCATPTPQPVFANSADDAVQCAESAFSPYKATTNLPVTEVFHTTPDILRGDDASVTGCSDLTVTAFTAEDAQSCAIAEDVPLPGACPK